MYGDTSWTKLCDAKLEFLWSMFRHGAHCDIFNPTAVSIFWIAMTVALLREIFIKIQETIFVF